MPIVNRIADFHADLTAWRHDIHAHPETAFEEKRTADSSRSSCRMFGIEVHRGLAGTGVVGTLKGARPGGRAIGLRADMDALHIQEKNAFAYVSINPGKMHACGHDGHTTMLLGAARYSRGDAQFRRHRAFHLPARRGERGRRPRDGRGGAVREIPGRGGLRHAQLAGHARSASSPCAPGR